MTGDGARLANCGSGEKEKFGEKGRTRPLPFMLGILSELLCSGGVKGGREDSGRCALASPGLGLDSVVPASEGRCTMSGCVADVGVASGGADWVWGVAFVLLFVVVARRRLFGWPFEYWEC